MGERTTVEEQRFPTGGVSGPPVLVVAALGLLALGIFPVAFSLPPLPTFFFFNEHPEWRWLGRGLLLGLMAAGIGLLVRLDSEVGTAKVVRLAGFALLAALLTDLHFHTVDVIHMKWQIEQYGSILMHTGPPPHQYRFVPQGLLWWFALGNGDFVFSYAAFRFCFTFLLCQAVYKLARLYLAPRDSVLLVCLYGAFYPLSIRYYYGNLLDPLSHLVMVAILYCCRRGQFQSVCALFLVGVCVKETTLVLAPCYCLMNLEAGRDRIRANLWRGVQLGALGLAAFFLCRAPFQFNYDFHTLNETSGLMIRANLGLSGTRAWSSVPVLQRHLHPVLFLFMWIPLIVWRRRWLPASLFWTALYCAGALYLTNLCFGWNHESRNFIPALVLLLTCTLLVVNRLMKENFPSKPPEKLV